MVATYAVQRITGTSGAPVRTTVTESRFRTDDTNTLDLTNACLIDSVTRYSYWTSICILLGGTFSEISNLRIHSAGDITWTLGTGGKIKLGNHDTGDIGVADASYEQATGTPGVTGNDLEASHSSFSGQTTKSVDLNTILVGAPKVVDTTKYTAVGRTKHVVLQAEIKTDGSSGVFDSSNSKDKTITFLVDEIN